MGSSLGSKAPGHAISPSESSQEKSECCLKVRTDDGLGTHILFFVRDYNIPDRFLWVSLYPQPFHKTNTEIRFLNINFLFLRKAGPELTSVTIFFYFICELPATAWLNKWCIRPCPGSELVNSGRGKWSV